MRIRECLYCPNTSDNGQVTNQASDIYRDGYFEYWGQSDVITYQENGTGGYLPIIRHVVVGVVQDKETGKVYICNAEQIIFRKHINTNSE